SPLQADAERLFGPALPPATDHPSPSFHASPPTHLHPLSLHDALPISRRRFDFANSESTHLTHFDVAVCLKRFHQSATSKCVKCEIGKHTSELQSRGHLVCRLLLEKKKRQDASQERTLRATLL